MKKVLVIVNIIVITILLVISCIMVYFSSSKSRELFGYTALLYHPIGTPSPSLYIVNRPSVTPNVGDEVILVVTNQQDETTVIIDTITENNNSILSLSQSDIMVDLLSADFTIECRRIAYKNAAMGRMIFAITKDLSPILVCVIIIGTTIIIGLIWMIILIKQKNKSTYFTSTNPLEVFINGKSSTDEIPDDLPIENSQITYVQEETSLTNEDSTQQSPIEHTMSFDINALIDEIIENANKDFISHQHDDLIP